MSKKATILLAGASLAITGTAHAQQKQPPKAPQVASGRAPLQTQAGGAPAATNGGPQAAPAPQESRPAISETAVAYARNGGSLLRATMATVQPSADPTRPAPDVSYFAVPEPEPKTIRKHDLITVVVREESSFASQGTTDVKREADFEAKLEQFIKLQLSNWEIEGGALGPKPPSIKGSMNSNFKGEGTANRRDSLIARMTAEVVDVKPNGTLVLQARKTIKTDDEEQAFVLTGICRVEDVVADNSVLSTQLYDLRLEKNTKGAVRAATKRGLLGQLLDAINPF